MFLKIFHYLNINRSKSKERLYSFQCTKPIISDTKMQLMAPDALTVQTTIF